MKEIKSLKNFVYGNTIWVSLANILFYLCNFPLTIDWPNLKAATANSLRILGSSSKNQNGYDNPK